MDINGLKTLAEMREEVWRRIDVLRPVNGMYTTTDNVLAPGVMGGEKPGDTVLSPTIALHAHNVTKEDLDMYLNTNLNKRFIDVMQEDMHHFEDTTYIDVKEDVHEYRLPVDLAVLRYVGWIPSGTTSTLTPALDYNILVYEDDPAGRQIDSNGYPTYTRRLDKIRLNAVPSTDQTRGIKIGYVKWIYPLLAEGQKIESLVARPMQELIILDTVVDVLRDKMKLDPTAVLLEVEEWLERLIIAAGQAHTPPVVQWNVDPKYRVSRRRQT